MIGAALGAVAVPGGAAASASSLLGPLAGAVGMLPGVGGDVGPGAAKMARPKIIGREILRTIGVPEFLRDEWRSEAKSQTWATGGRFSLDPDLQAMQSMSLSVKVLIQRERNLAVAEAEFWKDGQQSLARKLFKSLNGRINGVSHWNEYGDEADE